MKAFLRLEMMFAMLFGSRGASPLPTNLSQLEQPSSHKFVSPLSLRELLENTTALSAWALFLLASIFFAAFFRRIYGRSLVSRCFIHIGLAFLLETTLRINSLLRFLE